MPTMPDANSLARASWSLSHETLKYLVQSGILIPKDVQAIYSNSCEVFKGSPIASDQSALAFLEDARKAAL
ncbi:MAG: hypothetical protein EOS26_10370 [Mesorhizobium sp.]|nr:MAG: hypothetical protein EOS26_10370 [Mesorhizobium sp.]